MLGLGWAPNPVASVLIRREQRQTQRKGHGEDWVVQSPAEATRGWRGRKHPPWRPGGAQPCGTLTLDLWPPGLWESHAGVCWGVSPAPVHPMLCAHPRLPPSKLRKRPAWALLPAPEDVQLQPGAWAMLGSAGRGRWCSHSQQLGRKCSFQGVSTKSAGPCWGP